MLYTLDPRDVLFLRDARPFDAGDASQALSNFPPSPVTLQGMVRFQLTELELFRRKIAAKHYFDRANHTPEVDELRAWLGQHSGEFGRIRLRGPFLVGPDNDDPDNSPTLWLPMPLDASREYRPNGRPTDQVEFLVRQPAHDSRIARIGVASGVYGIQKALRPLVVGVTEPTDREFPERPFISLTQLGYAMMGARFQLAAEEMKLSEPEWRTGHARDPVRGTVETGLLYRAQVARPAPDVRLLFDLDWESDGRDAPQLVPGLPRLGGDGHIVTLETVADVHPIAQRFSELVDGGAARRTIIDNDGRFKLYFVTPAAFGDGWLPDGVDRETLEVVLVDQRCRLVAAAVGKPRYLGGWDIRRKRPKPLLAVVPAGSVFHFEPVGDLTSDELEAFADRLVRDHQLRPFPSVETNNEDKDQESWEIRKHVGSIGMGLTLVGSWQYQL